MTQKPIPHLYPGTEINMNPMPKMDVPGYTELAVALNMAYDQAAKGKGKERHANAKPFLKQPIFEISRMVGLGGLSYQVCKKVQEATGMAGRSQHNAAIAEFLGAIVYSAAAINLIAEQQQAETAGDPEMQTNIFTEYLEDYLSAQREVIFECEAGGAGVDADEEITFDGLVDRVTAEVTSKIGIPGGLLGKRR